MPPPLIASMSEIADRYDALLCDAWGVIHNGAKVFPGVAEAMQGFRERAGPVIILTNAPKPAAVIPAQLDRLGLPREAYDGVVTSGEATRAEIRKRLPGRPALIGWTSDTVLFDGLGVEFAPLDTADFIICTGVFEDGPDEPEGYRPMLEGPAKAGLQMICANPDIVVRWRGELMYCAGAVAREYEALGGEVVYAGKPFPAVYDLAFAGIETAMGREVSPSRVLAVGDGAGTDILGANRMGVDAVYVAGDDGVHSGGDSPEDVARALDAAGARAVGYMRGLSW